MHVPLSIRDFLERASGVYGDRVGVVDEPERTESLGEMTYRDLRDLASRQASTLDALGIAFGDRVAVVSQNSARLLTSFYGVAGFGRVLVPINFRLSVEEIEFIVRHSGARMLLVDPELADSLSGIAVEHKHVFGDDDFLYGPAGSPPPLAWEADEEATAFVNYTSGTTSRPKGVEITHRNAWLNATIFALHTSVTDRDVYLHTLPMFHANGWGMPFAMAGLGVKQVVQRKVDGHEILRRVEEHGVTILCGAPAVAAAILEAAQT